MQIDQDTLANLSKSTIDGNVLYLNCGQVDRQSYTKINKVLEAMGGKWDRKRKGHVFENDPTDLFENVILTGSVELPKKNGYFPTPREIALQLVEEGDVISGMSVLEPSAGQGAIAECLPDGCDVKCFELMETNVRVLKEKGLDVDQADFLSIDSKGSFDRVVMNPPFEKQADIDHVVHAFNFLKRGGRLVSVMSASVLFRENRKTVDFRDFIQRNGGRFERLPEKSFQASGTCVNTCYVVVDKS